jgi:uncharacterized protein involved in type VI secretion and phage assembly
MGVHRAEVIAADDPSRHGRVRIRIPHIGSDSWAPVAIPPAAFAPHPVPVGAGVWVAFEDDDLDRPIVLGLIEPLARRDALARDLEALGDAWDRGHAAGGADARGGTTPNPYR